MYHNLICTPMWTKFYSCKKWVLHQHREDGAGHESDGGEVGGDEQVDLKAVIDGSWVHQRFLIHQGMERRGSIESMGGDGRPVEREVKGWCHAIY
jgi:hypothetical protein